MWCPSRMVVIPSPCLDAFCMAICMPSCAAGNPSPLSHVIRAVVSDSDKISMFCGHVYVSSSIASVYLTMFVTPCVSTPRRLASVSALAVTCA